MSDVTKSSVLIWFPSREQTVDLSILFDKNTLSLKTVDCVSTWLSSPDRLQSMKDAALEASRPTATVDIAKDLAKMLFEEKELQKSLERNTRREPVLVSK